MSEEILRMEGAVLGCMLIAEDAVVQGIELLRPEDFSRGTHRAICRAIFYLSERNEPVDAVTVAGHLERTGQLQDIGGRAALVDLADSVAHTGNFEYCARQIRDHALRRQLQAECSRIAAKTEDESVDTETLIEETEQSLYRLADRQNPEQYSHISEIVSEVLEDANRMQRDPTQCVGLPTGFVDLDRLICGLEPGTSYIIAGRPSMGKTALAMNIVHNVAERGIPVAVFSLEMPKKQLGLRMICSAARVDVQRFRSGRCSNQESDRAVQAAGKLHDLPIYIDDSSGISSQQIRAKARRLKARKKIRLIVIDYLQLIVERSAQNQEHQAAMASAAVKAIAKELQIPVIALSQLNRASEEGQKPRRPRLADLRYSGAIEQDADVVMFIYRPEPYKSGDNPGVAEIIVEKQRNGPTGTIELTFLKESVRFENHQQGEKA